jgi:hypothetical protein
MVPRVGDVDVPRAVHSYRLGLEELPVAHLQRASSIGVKAPPRGRRDRKITLAPPLGQKSHGRATDVELLNAMVALVGDVDEFSRAVQRNADGGLKLAVATAARAPLAQKPPGRVEFLYSVVAAVHHIDVSRSVYSDIRGAVELAIAGNERAAAVGIKTASPCAQQAPTPPHEAWLLLSQSKRLRVKPLNAMVLGIGDVDPSWLSTAIPWGRRNAPGSLPSCPN